MGAHSTGALWVRVVCLLALLVLGAIFFVPGLWTHSPVVVIQDVRVRDNIADYGLVDSSQFEMLLKKGAKGTVVRTRGNLSVVRFEVLMAPGQINRR